MWPTFRLNSAMDSPPSIAHSRPWTPPDTDSEYFTDPFGTDSVTSDDPTDSWPDHELISPRNSSGRPKPVSSVTDPYYTVKAPAESEAHLRNEKLGYAVDVAPHDVASVKSSPARAHLEVQRLPSAPILSSPAKGKKPSDAHVAYAQDWEGEPQLGPHTPVKPLRTPEPRIHDGIPQYPYTPDSVRTNRTYQLPAPLRPLSPMPWEARKDSSPVQSALSSCILHLENLIDTRQPNDEQMEYLVTKFEEMAQFLSAPEAQSRQSDDHLFSELEIPAGLSIASVNDREAAKELALGASYIQEVDRYIDGVKKHAEDLRMRMDEVKQLNSIQLDIITDLRRELKHSTLLEEQPRLDSTEATPQVSKKIPLQRNGFWASIGEALDLVGEMLFEW